MPSSPSTRSRWVRDIVVAPGRLGHPAAERCSAAFPRAGRSSSRSGAPGTGRVGGGPPGGRRRSPPAGRAPARWRPPWGARGCAPAHDRRGRVDPDMAGWGGLRGRRAYARRCATSLLPLRLGAALVWMARPRDVPPDRGAARRPAHRGARSTVPPGGACAAAASWSASRAAAARPTTHPSCCAARRCGTPRSCGCSPSSGASAACCWSSSPTASTRSTAPGTRCARSSTPTCRCCGRSPTGWASTWRPPGRSGSSRRR